MHSHATGIRRKLEKIQLFRVIIHLDHNMTAATNSSSVCQARPACTYYYVWLFFLTCKNYTHPPISYFKRDMNPHAYLYLFTHPINTTNKRHNERVQKSKTTTTSTTTVTTTSTTSITVITRVPPD